jgi:hypothetical protein
MSVLRKANISGSLEYWGRCDNASGVPDYPRLKASWNNKATPVETLREMFSEDPEMQVTQDADGTIRMAETDVPRDLLDLTINHISFDKIIDPRIGQDPTDALRIIMSSPEVSAFMKSGSIRRPYPLELMPSLRSPGAPRISGNLDGATVSQALDYVLKVFPGFWVYENCSTENHERVVYLRFKFDTVGWAARANHR